jgi:membrane-associated phospholipid phosphatase
MYASLLIVLVLGAVSIDKGQCVLWINGHNAPILDGFFKSFTNLGDGLIFLPFITILLFVQFRYALMAVTLMVGNALLVSLFKRVLFYGLERPRTYLGEKFIHLVPGVEVHGINSFPSGHTATAFSVALFIGFLSGNNFVRVLALFTAALVAYSRMYLAQHFLIDVAGGAFIGTFTTYILWHVFDNIDNPKWMTLKLRLPRQTARSGSGNADDDAS